MKQKWYDDNRKRFDADSTAVEVKPIKCDHDLQRRGDDLVCTRCGAGWPQLARYVKLANQK